MDGWEARRSCGAQAAADHYGVMKMGARVFFLGDTSEELHPLHVCVLF